MGHTNKPIRFERKLLNADAFRSLGKTALLVYLDFLAMRKMQRKRKSGREDTWIIINNGELEYPYSYAEKKGISRSRFMRALDELVGKGFIDIAHSGAGGVKGDKSKYGISNRWEKWGTADFVQKFRPRDTRKGRGFLPGNKHWRKAKKHRCQKR
ncbi:MAG: hypothetical protein ABIF87_06920 [Pseudomonadota bacterium]